MTMTEQTYERRTPRRLHIQKKAHGEEVFMNQNIPQEYHFDKVGREFRLNGTILRVEQINSGNINKTFKVTYLQDDGSEKSYLFQKVNTYVFKKPIEVMENIDKVTTHIYKKRGGVNALHFHHTEDRKNYYFEEGTDYFWRVRNFFESVTYDVCEDVQAVYMAGVAFGSFQMDLQDFDAAQLHETIVDFHNTRKRLETLYADAEEDVCGRLGEVKEELDYIKSVSEKACSLVDMLKNGKLPLRVTHNDTKINNVLFDITTGSPLTVIDLDTVMPGLVGYDFGDAIRFAANTSAEDEPDLTKVSMDMECYRAFAEGFLLTLAKSLTQEEISTLALGAFCITIELASRFLDDYLTGDKYFKICYEKHNLVRARAQLALAKDMEKKLGQMQRIVDEYAAKSLKE